MRRGRYLCCFFGLLFCGACEPQQPVDSNPTTTIAAPASRVVTLAPHLAELIFAVGAGDTLVGVSAYTDYPERALSLPVVGDAFLVDQEQLALLRPDLLLAWASGTPQHVVDQLRAVGYRVESIRTRGLDDVGLALEKIGALTGHVASADIAATAYRGALHALAEKHAAAPAIRVFYQVSQQPIYTINGDHYVSQLIELCGGHNIFAELSELAPLVSEEAVLERDPEILLAAADASQDALANWQRWPGLAANRYRNHWLLPAAEIGRASPRLSSAGEVLCGVLEQARDNRQSALQQS